MKQSPQQQRLEQIMRSSKIVAGGLLGDDPRSVDEIIAADGVTVERAGYTIARIAERMQQISDLAAPGLGRPRKLMCDSSSAPVSTLNRARRSAAQDRYTAAMRQAPRVSRLWI